MSGKLSTHVLDNHCGKPAAGIAWTLSRQSDKGWEALAQGLTNSDGRTSGPLLDAEALTTGRYRISFDVAAYYSKAGIELPDPPFLDTVCLEVNLIAGESYHVPLLMTPWSYSTYRGS